MKKLGNIVLLLLLVAGCSNKNIEIPREHVAPKVPMKNDSYIFLDELNHRNIVEKIGTDRYRVVFTAKSNDIEEVNIIYGDKKLRSQNLESIGSFRGVEFFSGEVVEKSGKLEYMFELKDGRVAYYYGKTRGYNPNNIVKSSYEGMEVEGSSVPEWSKNAMWYGIYVDSFENGNRDNDPIFNEFGPEYFFESRALDSKGEYKGDLIDRDLWRSVDALGEFEISDWKGNNTELEIYEKNIASKYMKEVGRNTRRYGGDIQGVEGRLEYLKDLGIDIVNLSPVFYSYSRGKNDTIDYRHISPDLAQMKTGGASEYRLLGGELGETLDSSTWKMTASDKEFSNFIKKANELGIKVVLDVDISSVSNRFFAIKDLMLMGKESQYIDWFTLEGNYNDEHEYSGTSTIGVVVKEDGKTYRSAFVKTPEGSSKGVEEEVYRWNLKNLKPRSKGNMKLEINYTPEYIEYLKEALGKWIDLGVAGYRMEVEGVDRWVVDEIISSLREKNNEAIFISSFEQGKVLGEEEFTGKDNYLLGDIILRYVQGELSKDDLENAFIIYSRINEVDKMYASPLYLDSNRTDRLYSRMANSYRRYDTLNTPGEGYKGARPDLVDSDSTPKTIMAIGLQITGVGAPYMYYGTELGMWGADEPDNKKPMIWDNSYLERDVYSNYSNLRGASVNKSRNYVEYEAKKNSEIEKFVGAVTKFRGLNNKLFKDGKLRYLDVAEDENMKDTSDIIAYERVLGEKRAIIVVNRGDASKEVGVYTEGRGRFKSLFDGTITSISGKRLKVEVEPLSFNIYYN